MGECCLDTLSRPYVRSLSDLIALFSPSQQYLAHSHHPHYCSPGFCFCDSVCLVQTLGLHLNIIATFIASVQHPANSIVLYHICRPSFWFWESVVLVQTLGLAAAQVFANTLDSFFQVIIMLVILGFGTVALAYLHPLDQWEPQLIQVCSSNEAKAV